MYMYIYIYTQMGVAAGSPNHFVTKITFPKLGA